MTGRVAVGICTYNRPEYLAKTAKAAGRVLAGVVDRWYVYDDGSDRKYHGSYQRAYRPVADRGGQVIVGDTNRGVAYAKNRLLEAMIEDGAAWLFLAEDDIKPVGPQAVTGYVAACEESGLGHLMFAHHGPANRAGPLAADGPVVYFPHAVGGWCIYSRRSLETCGLFDENFVNAWEHVEHSLRLALAGFTTGPYRWADASGSGRWLEELPGSIDRSSIRPRPDWHHNIVSGLRYWQSEKPDTFDLLFGPGTPLEGWAHGLLASPAAV